MKVKKIDEIEKLDYKNLGYAYAWIQECDRVVLGKISEIEMNLDNVIEARLFSTEKELHVYDQDGLKAVETVCESDDDFFEEKQLLRKKYGKSIMLRNYVDYETDGQAYIVKTVLSDCVLD